MNIGIDIDGVLTDELGFIVEYGTKYFTNKNIEYNLHKEIYDSKETFQVTEQLWKEFWKENIFDYSKNTQIRPFASEVINKLKKKNNKIFIITARYYTTYENENKELMQNTVKEWLNKNNVLYDDIIFTENKAEVCNKLNIDVMIEDKPDNILDISKIISVICYDHPYNQGLSNINIIRCYNWNEIYEKMIELNKGE